MFSIKYLAIYTLFLPIIASVIVGLSTRVLTARIAQLITVSAIFAKAIKFKFTESSIISIENKILIILFLLIIIPHIPIKNNMDVKIKK